MIRKISLTIIGLGILLLIPILAQEKTKSISQINDEIEAGHFTIADSLLRITSNHFFSQNNFDTLIHFIPLVGKIAYQGSKAENASTAVFSFVEKIKSKTNDPYLLLRAYREIAEYLGSIFQNQQGYNACKEALKYAYLYPGKDSLEVARSEYNLGVYAHRLGNISLAGAHHRRAFYLREASPNTTNEDIYFSGNAMGSIMWYSSKYDSATIFYNKALDALEKMSGNDLNKYYRTAIIENNLAGLYNLDGKTSEAIASMQRTIENYQHFIASKEPHPKKEDALVGLFQAIDNLAGIYKEIGDYNKAEELLLYSYNQKKQKLTPDNTDVSFSEVLLGQYYNSLNDYDKALQYLTTSLTKLENAEGDYLIWKADASYAIALAYENKKNAEKANEFYAKSEALYEQAFRGEYDNIYMDFLRNAALFYAANNQYKKAIGIATKAYNYLVKVHEEKGLQGFYQRLNIAEVEYSSQHYAQAIENSQLALDVIKNKIKESNNLLDSAKIEMYKPKAILVNTKAGYALQQNKTVPYLNQLMEQLNEALQTLEKRKVVIDDPESINILIAENEELIDFAKKIELELYQQTKDDSYLDKLINLHESGLYNRIRSNLDKEKAIRFANLPREVQDQERRLKEAIPASLEANKPNSVLMNDYIEAVHKWEEHLDSVKINYPAYYNMRYGSIFKPLPELQSSIPTGSSLIRYFFVDSSLLALVADSTNKTLIKLNNDRLENKITALLQNNTSEKEQTKLLYELYKKLWLPLESNIHTKKVTIIPDGILFNLSFEMLTTKPTASFGEIPDISLLAKFAISYHYSLFMFDQKEEDIKTDKNYIAFVPGFSDKMKKEYASQIKDSVNLDYQYLQLLPQPNTSKLAEKVKSKLNGSVYLEDASTQRSFISNAADHKIIHIGTHAEYNNIRPERSRLIFAKNINSAEDTNSLYLSDIYNCNINSDLTILTACESGKPGFKDGEGMISLAHAFNYAGSRSILTGLWKLDEQSSNIITDLFIQNLMKKMPEDEALREAKLQYIKQADGRMKTPAYWAGIVLMGKPEIIKLERSVNYLPWIILAGAGLLLILFFIFRWKRKNASVPL
jgi:CHAT domain-containing protein